MGVFYKAVIFVYTPLSQWCILTRFFKKKNVLLSSSTSSAGQQQPPDFQNSSRGGGNKPPVRHPELQFWPWMSAGWLIVLFLDFGASDTNRDPCFTVRENYVRISEWLLTPRKIWACKENGTIGSGKKSTSAPTAHATIRRQERDYGKSLCTHSVVTKASAGNTQRIHSSALCSVSGPRGLEYNFRSCPFIGHFLPWPFSLQRTENRLSLHSSIQTDNVIHCRLQCLSDHVTFSSRQNTYTRTQTSSQSSPTHTVRNTHTPSAHTPSTANWCEGQSSHW